MANTGSRITVVAFGLVALVIGLSSFDLARGRVADTRSELIADVVAASRDKQCGGDVTPVLARYFPAGMSRNAALAALAEVRVNPPRPWFWTPKMDDKTLVTPEKISAIRTIRAVYSGQHDLSLTLEMADEKITAGKGEVVCSFR
jgi:hypothetical protein